MTAIFSVLDALHLRSAFDFEFVYPRLGFGCTCWVRSPLVDQAFARFVANADWRI